MGCREQLLIKAQMSELFPKMSVLANLISDPYQTSRQKGTLGQERGHALIQESGWATSRRNLLEYLLQ